MADLAKRENYGLGRSVFGDLLGWDPFRNFTHGFGSWTGMEVTRTEDGGYTVEIPVAGFKPDEIGVSLEDNVLTVNGKSDKRQFTRSLMLPDEIDSERIDAKVEHGLLTLTLRVHPKAQPKKIPVKFG